MLTSLRPECQSDRLQVTQVMTPLTGGTLGLVIDPLEAIGQEQADQPRNFNELLLLLGDGPHGLVKRLPEQVPELLLVGVVARVGELCMERCPRPRRAGRCPNSHLVG